MDPIIAKLEGITDLSLVELPSGKRIWASPQELGDDLESLITIREAEALAKALERKEGQRSLDQAIKDIRTGNFIAYDPATDQVLDSNTPD